MKVETANRPHACVAQHLAIGLSIMKSPKFAFAIVALGAAVALLASGAISPSADRFEYRVVKRFSNEHSSVLNELGAEGWELVTITTLEHEPPALYLKRRVR